MTSCTYLWVCTGLPVAWPAWNCSMRAAWCIVAAAAKVAVTYICHPCTHLRYIQEFRNICMLIPCRMHMA